MKQRMNSIEKSHFGKQQRINDHMEERMKQIKTGKLRAMCLMIAAMVLVGSFSMSFAAGVTAKITSGIAASQYQGEGTITVSITTNQAYPNAKIRLDHDGLVHPPAEVTKSLTVEENPNIVSIPVNLYNLTLGKTYFVKAVVTDSSGTELATSANGSIRVSPVDPEDAGKPNLSTIDQKDNSYKPDNTIQYNPQVKLSLQTPSGGLNAGATNQITLNIRNIGNAPFNQVIAGVGTLGDKMSLRNASTEQSLGKLALNASASASFPVYIESSHDGGDVPLSFQVRATDPSGKETTFTITEYVTVNGGTSLADRLEITNIQNPQQVVADQNFNLRFSVTNHSSSEAKNVKVMVEPTAPLVNRTKNIFVVNLPAGSSQSFDVQMFVPQGSDAQAQNYPIKITAETSGKDASSITQYTGVFVNASSDKTVPQIIITNYGYGGAPVVANETFPLSLELKNTNTKQTLKNIRVSMAATDGVFIPHDTSSSFYIASIGPNGSVTKTIQMMTVPDAPEKTTAISVDITYEDEKGNPISSKDMISVPVVQERRLEIDDVRPMEPLFVGQQMNISVQYYNMGKNTLNNLIISAEGDFDFPQATKSFVGKMDSGKNDFYDLAIIPTHTGEAQGKLIFRFEDSNGKQITIEKPFTLTAEEMPVMDLPDDMPEDAGGSGKAAKIGGGIAALAAVGGIVLYRRKKKKQRAALDMDTEE